MKKCEYPWNIMKNAYSGKMRDSKALDPLSSLQLKKLEDYFYEITYDTDFDYAQGEIYLSKYGQNFGGCSAARKSNLIGRNYDWYYDNVSEFVVHSSRTNNRFASIGIAAGMMGLNNDFVESGIWSDEYNYLPFYTLDGINEYGVFVEDNVVSPGDKGWTIGTNPGMPRMMALMIPRFILDHATSVDDAIALLKTRDIYGARTSRFTEEFHIMVADKTKTVEIEFVNNEMVIIENPKIVTNFYLHGFLGETKTGFEIEGGIEPEDTTLTAHAMGVERYDILQAGIDSVESEEDMVDLMKQIWYTKTYKADTNPFWYSEMVGPTKSFGDLTIYQNKSAYSGIIEIMKEMFEHRTREEKNTWQTVHSSVYNLEDKSFQIIVQEGEKNYKFSL